MATITWTPDAEARFRAIFGQLTTLTSIRVPLHDAIEDIARQRIADYRRKQNPDLAYAFDPYVQPRDVDTFCSYVARYAPDLSRESEHAENEAKDGSDHRLAVVKTFCAMNETPLIAYHIFDWSTLYFVCQNPEDEHYLLYLLDTGENHMKIEPIGFSYEAHIAQPAMIALLRKIGSVRDAPA